MTIHYRPARYEGGAQPRRATVRPYLIEPSLQTHALYLIGFDEERAAIRTFKIERIESASLTPRTFERPDPAATTADLRRAWDIIADQEPTEVVLRFAPAVAARVGETPLAPDARSPRPSRTARCAGARRSPGPSRSGSGSCPGATMSRSSTPSALRDDVAATHRRAASRYHP